MNNSESKSQSPAEGDSRKGCLSRIGLCARTGIYFLTLLWTFGAIYFDGPSKDSTWNLVMALLWIVVTLVLLLTLPGVKRRFLIWAGAIAIVIIPWLTIQPSNDRDWKPEWKETGWAEIEGDRVTFHNFRNFDHKLDGSVTERWETKTVHLSNLQGIDCFLDAFGGELIAHPIFSYDFGEEGRIALSIETRREKGEDFSTFGGLYKMFELQYLFGDERDFIRTRILLEEPIHLYRLKITPERMRESFQESIATLNHLRKHPAWYNVLTNNCTTSVRVQTPEGKRAPFDYRLLVNGKLDELAHERGTINTGGLSFPELRKQSLINDKAKLVHEEAEFSELIREGRPGF